MIIKITLFKLKRFKSFYLEIRAYKLKIYTKNNKNVANRIILSLPRHDLFAEMKFKIFFKIINQNKNETKL